MASAEPVNTQKHKPFAGWTRGNQIKSSATRSRQLPKAWAKVPKKVLDDDDFAASTHLWPFFAVLIRRHHAPPYNPTSFILVSTLLHCSSGGGEKVAHCSPSSSSSIHHDQQHTVRDSPQCQPFRSWMAICSEILYFS